MTELRSELRNEGGEIAKPEWEAVGRRIASIRGQTKQPDRAVQLGVSKTTYGRWERGVREIGTDGMAALVKEGWNVNWILTGDGPERLNTLQDKALSIAEDARGYASHPVSADHLTIALEMAEGKLEQEKLWLPKRDFAELVLLILEKLQEEWSYKRIREFVGEELKRLSKGESDAGSGQEVDEPGAGRTVEGEAQAPVKGDW